MDNVPFLNFPSHWSFRLKEGVPLPGFEVTNGRGYVSVIMDSTGDVIGQGPCWELDDAISDGMTRIPLKDTDTLICEIQHAFIKQSLRRE